MISSSVKDWCYVTVLIGHLHLIILHIGTEIQSSNNFSYSSSTLGRQSSFRDESSRVGRTRARDSSIDCTTRIR